MRSAMRGSAIALLLAATMVVSAPSDAKPKSGLHAGHHAKNRTQIVHSPARLRPAQPDPYADYWNDPSRQGFPSWGLTGN
jgi:hypothetical protein